MDHLYYALYFIQFLDFSPAYCLESFSAEFKYFLYLLFDFVTLFFLPYDCLEVVEMIISPCLYNYFLITLHFRLVFQIADLSDFVSDSRGMRSCSFFFFLSVYVLPRWLHSLMLYFVCRLVLNWKKNSCLAFRFSRNIHLFFCFYYVLDLLPLCCHWV